MKNTILILFISVGPWIIPVNGQRMVTLKECYEKAYAASPIAGENSMYASIWELKDRNLSRSWLPSLDANGNFIYNSSVVDMTEVLGSLPVPGITDFIRPLPHEQYKFTLDINQLIYDGGAIRNTRMLDKVDLAINRKQTESDLYKLRGQINNCYFNLLLLDRQKELQLIYLELINKRIMSLNSAIANGVLQKSDRDILESEKIRLEQQLNENDIRKTTLLKILSDLTGMQIDHATQFTLPAAGQIMTDGLTRPELQIFDLRKEQLQASVRLIQSKRMPKAFGFATLGYGNPPGSNFFKDEFAPYYIIGAGLKWNIFDWNKVRDEKQSLTLQQNILDTRKSDMEDNLKRLLDAKSAEIKSLESLLKADIELIEIRKRITSTAGSQYENGSITAADYMNELNTEKQTMINHEIHKINLALVLVEYSNICGKEIE